MKYLGDAVYSPCEKYRYQLWRRWGKGKYVQFICLNPSTATEYQNDPTVTRCINYAKAWGYDGMCMTNIFAYRATDPNEMKSVRYPVGCDNNINILRVCMDASLVVVAWGNHGSYCNRGKEVLDLLDSEVHYLRLTNQSQPAHPLYLPASLQPIPWIIK